MRCDNPTARFKIAAYKDFNRANDVATLDALYSSYDAFQQFSLNRKLSVNQLCKKKNSLPRSRKGKKEPH